MKFATLSLCAVAVLASGCATILNEPTQAVNITSSHGKPITGSVDGKTFTTPAVVNVTRTKASKVITSETAGCAKDTALASEVDSKFFINILSGGVFGSTTDYSSERMWRYADSVAISCAQ